MFNKERDISDSADWERTVEDARKFLSNWGVQAEALGWTSDDLFELAPIPDDIPSDYRRLSHYELTGLIWLLRGWPVVALERTQCHYSSGWAGSFFRYTARLASRSECRRFGISFKTSMHNAAHPPLQSAMGLAREYASKSNGRRWHNSFQR